MESGTIVGTKKEDLPLLPPIPNLIETKGPEAGGDQVINFWKRQLEVQAETGEKTRVGAPAVVRTLISPEWFLMINLIPQDSFHPLYSKEYKDLTDEFILDLISTEAIDLNAVTNENPVTRNSMSGKVWEFKKNAEGELTVNDVVVISHENFPEEQTNVIVLSDFLFGHREKVRDAWEEMKKTRPAPNPWAQPDIAPSPE